MTQLTIFLDDGGVLNDNHVRKEQWKRMVPEYLVPVLGGSPEAWSEANHTVIMAILAQPAWDDRLRAAPNYADFERAYFADWLGMMCDIVGVQRPGDDESLRLGREVTASIIPRVRSAFPGVVEAVRLLHSRGHALHTASGESSYDLEAYLDGMGIRSLFSRLYGPDLVETFKVGPEFYVRMFEDAGVGSEDALVVDDNPTVIGWAAQAGARTVLIDAAQGNESSRATYTMRALAELPGVLERLG